MSVLFKVAGPTGEPTASVLFVHGLGGHHYDTWRCGPRYEKWDADKTFWPRWLAHDCGTLAIYVIGYDAPVSRFRGTAMHLPDQATSILARLLAEPGLRHGPLIFIGHSLGGLIIKELLRTAESMSRYDDRAADLIERVKKVAFLGTPHSGAGLATCADRLRILLRPSAATACLVRNDPSLRDLNNWYRDWANDRHLDHLILSETKPANVFGVIVQPDSADPGLANVRVVPIEADHVAICKPVDKTIDIYVLVQDFVSRPLKVDRGPSPLEPDLENGFKILGNEIEKDPHVRMVVTASREKLDKVKNSIDILFHFKELHDCLHEIQLRHYREVIGCAKELETNPQASFELQQHIIDMTKLCNRARKAAELLPETGADRQHVIRWIEELESAIPKLKVAVRDEDKQGATAAASPFRTVIIHEQNRVNGHLNRLAEELPLRELSDIVKTVVDAKPAGDASRLELQKMIDVLDNNKSQLDKRIAEHDQWQRIEKDFWEAEDNVERKTPESLDQFKESWSTIKLHVDALASAQAQSEWAKDSKEYANQIDKTAIDSVAPTATNFESLRRNFKLFRDNALYHFFWVNLDLKAQCEQILKIREPLQGLLDKV